MTKMTYQVLKQFSDEAGRRHNPGELLDLNKEAADKLIKQGVIKERKANQPEETKEEEDTGEDK